MLLGEREASLCEDHEERGPSPGELTETLAFDAALKSPPGFELLGNVGQAQAGVSLRRQYASS